MSDDRVVWLADGTLNLRSVEGATTISFAASSRQVDEVTYEDVEVTVEANNGSRVSATVRIDDIYDVPLWESMREYIELLVSTTSPLECPERAMVNGGICLMGTKDRVGHYSLHFAVRELEWSVSFQGLSVGVRIKLEEWSIQQLREFLKTLSCHSL